MASRHQPLEGGNPVVLYSPFGPQGPGDGAGSSAQHMLVTWKEEAVRAGAVQLVCVSRGCIKGHGAQVTRSPSRWLFSCALLSVSLWEGVQGSPLEDLTGSHTGAGRTARASRQCSKTAGHEGASQAGAVAKVV